MEKKPTKPMTPFDEVTIPFELTLLKLILPYTSADPHKTDGIKKYDPLF